MAASTGVPGALISIVAKISFYPIDNHIKSQKNFVKKSRKYLDDYMKKNPDISDVMFFALSEVTWMSVNYNTGKTNTHKAYKGDKHVETIV